MCVEAKRNDSPHGSVESSDVLYGDDPLVYFMLNNFIPTLNILNGNIIIFKTPFSELGANYDKITRNQNVILSFEKWRLIIVTITRLIKFGTHK